MSDDPGAGVHGDPRDLSVDELAFAGVEACTHVEAQFFDGFGDRAGAANRPRRSVEGSEEAVAGGIDLFATGAREFASDQGVVALEEFAPTGVSEFYGGCRGVGDVGEKDGAKDAIRGVAGVGHIPRVAGKRLDRVKYGPDLGNRWDVALDRELGEN
jgi:hypothetical protein